MSTPFNVKDSVNLPKTRFKMQANLAQNEPRMLEFWDGMGLYHRILQKNLDRPAYILHDGPPYANGNIHIGHALNKILKDFIVKYKSMKGFYSPYVPGWDCHGLPIEKKVESELGFDRKKMDIVEFRGQCREYAKKFVGIQREQFKRLGVFGDWENPYQTMSYAYEATIARAFGDFVGMGSVYKGAKPVLWCLSCQTALAEAEVEYENHTSPSVYVRFPARTDFSRVVPELAGKAVGVVIWTTTPWTLPANLAIAFHPDYDYVALETGGQVHIAAEGLANAFLSACGLEGAKLIARFRGEVLEGQSCTHPFLDRESLVVLADYVTLDQGTGCVHTAPGHGQEDYVTGQKYGLSTLCPVDHEGRFTEEGGPFAGRTVFEANADIVRLMEESGVLLHGSAIDHSYPHCWRCHNPVIFRSTPQWFISMENADLRKKALEEIRKVKWYPAWGEERIFNMIANRPDWCISRQRYWGSPITVFYCRACGAVLMNRNLVRHVADIFEKEGADAWYRRKAGELLPEGTTCPKCGRHEFEKEFDILDVWFDSGVSYQAVSLERAGHPWPSDMYLEGGDQFRGWFHSSLLASLGCRGSSPYREVLTHGWALDKDGLAMSKSRGNVIEPAEVIKAAGAEVLRLWVGSCDYQEDVRISGEILERLKEAYRKIRNTLRYLLANLYRESGEEGAPASADPFNFDPGRHAVDAGRMVEIDRWALARMAQAAAQCETAYERYEFHVVSHQLYNLCAVDLSAVYFDILKDRLYTSAADSTARRSAQTALWGILHTMVRLLAPLLPFTTEEVWQKMREFADLPESVHLADFPGAAEISGWADEALLARWEKLWLLREQVSKAMEPVRQAGAIGNSLEARVVLRVSPGDAAFLAPLAADLRYLLIVSEAVLEAADVPDGSPEVRVEAAAGAKCERCWNRSPRVGEFTDFPTVCERCLEVVRELAGRG